MGFAISRKIIHSGRARWLYQLRTLTAKESSMRHLKFVVNYALVLSSIGAFTQDSARTVQYHSQDIIPIRAKLKYTTLIELPRLRKSWKPPRATKTSGSWMWLATFVL